MIFKTRSQAEIAKGLTGSNFLRGLGHDVYSRPGQVIH